MGTILEVRDLVKIYRAAADEAPALGGVSLCIGEGEFVAIMGPSGSGKSTLMNIFGCLDRPTMGTYILDGVDGRLVGRPSEIGTPSGKVAVAGRAGIPLGTAAGALAAARSPGDPFGLVLARAGAPASQPAGPRTLVVMIETSAAMTEEARRRQRKAVEDLAAALPPDTHLTLLGADWTVELLAEQVRPAALEAALERLDAVPSAGALDLEAALLAAAERARAIGASAVIFVGRGVDAFEGDAVEAPLKRLRAARIKLLALGTDGVPGPLADAAWLTGGRALDAGETTRPSTLAALLAAPGIPPARLSAASEVAPVARKPDGLGPAGSIAGGHGNPLGVPISVDDWQPLETVTGEVRWIGRVMGALPAVERAAADDLEALFARARLTRDDAERASSGRPHRILTPLTSLLVLEKDDDYRRWGLPAPATPASWWSPRKRVDNRRGLDGAPLGFKPTTNLGSAQSAEGLPEWMKQKGEDGGRARRASREGLVGASGTAGRSDPVMARYLAEDAARRGSVLGVFRSSSGSHTASNLRPRLDARPGRRERAGRAHRQ